MLALAREAVTLIAACEAEEGSPGELDLERRAAIERDAARSRARSLEGGMFQLMLARSDAEYLSHLADGSRSAEAEEIRRRIDGLLYSLLRLLEELSGTPAEALGAGHYMDRRYDPHARVLPPD